MHKKVATIILNRNLPKVTDLLFNKLKQKLHEIISIFKGITKLLSLSITKKEFKLI